MDLVSWHTEFYSCIRHTTRNIRQGNGNVVSVTVLECISKWKLKIKYGWSPQGEGNWLRKRSKLVVNTWQEKGRDDVKRYQKKIKRKQKNKNYGIPQLYGRE